MTFVDGIQIWMEPYLACHINDTIFNPSFGEGSVGMQFVKGKLRELEKTEDYIALRKKMKEIIDKSPGIIDQENIR